MCGNGFTCATNDDNAVACASGTLSPFYTACLDYRAFKAGSCLSLDAATGCWYVAILIPLPLFGFISDSNILTVSFLVSFEDV